jgi:hypothetical protein
MAELTKAEIEEAKKTASGCLLMAGVGAAAFVLVCVVAALGLGLGMSIVRALMGW